MLAQKLTFKSKTSWATFYYILTFVLGHGKLNYLTETFNPRLWEKVFMYGILLFQMFVGVICIVGLVQPNNYDMVDKVSCVIIFFTEISIGLKALTVINYNVLLKKLSETIMNETSHGFFEAWELKLARKYYRVAKLICIKVIFLYGLTMISFIGMPIFSDKNYMMPILMEFPGTNRTGNSGYLINYALGAYNVFYGTSMEMGFDLPAFLQGCFIAFQLDRCVHYCKMIGDLDSSYDTQEKQSVLLKNCIKLHGDIFNFINQVAIINTSAVAITIMTTVPLQIGLLYSILMGTVSTSLSMMITAVYHLFLYCCLGEIVSIKCHEASNAIYNSQWYNLHKIKDRQTFLFFLTVSQTNMRFSAGGLFNLSLETFTELMKLIYATSAFLQEVI